MDGWQNDVQHGRGWKYARIPKNLLILKIPQENYIQFLEKRPNLVFLIVFFVFFKRKRVGEYGFFEKIFLGVYFRAKWHFEAIKKAI